MKTKKRAGFWATDFRKLRKETVILSVIMLAVSFLLNFLTKKYLVGYRSNSYLITIYEYNLVVLLCCVFYTVNFFKIQKRSEEKLGAKKFLSGFLPIFLTAVISVLITVF